MTCAICCGLNIHYGMVNEAKLSLKPNYSESKALNPKIQVTWKFESSSNVWHFKVRSQWWWNTMHNKESTATCKGEWASRRVASSNPVESGACLLTFLYAAYSCCQWSAVVVSLSPKQPVYEGDKCSEVTCHLWCRLSGLECKWRRNKSEKPYCNPCCKRLQFICIGHVHYASCRV